MYPNYQQYGYQNPNQVQFGAGITQRPQPKYTQPLSPEIISKLRSNGGAFKIEVSQEDLWRAACTHKENGQMTLVREGVNPDTQNEVVHCTICGETFEIVDTNRQDAQKTIDNVINLLQTSKTIYLDAPEQLVSQYYQMIPLLKMFPELYERSLKNFANYENALNVTPNPAVAGANGFQMMGAMLSNPYAAYGYPMMGAQPPMYQQPAPMGYAPMQPQGYPQQQYQQPNPYAGYPQQYAQPAPMAGNPMMYNAQPAPAPAPMAGAVPPAPTEQNGEVSQQKQFNV